MSESIDRDLVLGTIAQQLGLVTEQQLSESIDAFDPESSDEFGTILRKRADIDDDAWDSLATIVNKQIEAHDGSLTQSLGTLVGRGNLVPDPVVDALENKVSEDVWHTFVKRRRKGSADDSQDADSFSTFVRKKGDGNEGDDETGGRDGSGDREGSGAGDDEGSGDRETQRSERFQKLRPHAEGGLGQVFVALDDELNRQVALKQIQTQLTGDADARQRFMLEAEITGGLEHPGVVPVYGLGIHEDGQPYYAMRFIRGESMQAAIDTLHSSEGHAQDSPSDRMFAMRKLLSRVIDVCQAIGYAHSRGVLHRDIKPENIMLGKFGETLVVDWGLAKVAGDESSSAPQSQDASDVRAAHEARLRPASASDSAPTVMGSVVGTLAFMSPEQAAGDIDAVDARSDVFSLGATLYALLVGRPAMTSKGADGKPRSVTQILEAIQRGEFKRTREAAPSIPKPLAAICDRAMALDADNRYDTAVRLADDIERWLADEPVSAYQESAWERSRRWVKRHQSLATSLAAVILVSIAGLSVFSFVLNQKNTQLADYAESLTEKNTELDRRGNALQQSNAALRLAERKARDEAATALAVTDFLNDDLLSQASRRDHPNPRLEVRTVLDRAAENLNKDFADRPLVKANLLKTIGVAYGYLGEYQKSQTALASSVELFKEHLGAEHETTVARESELAAVLAKAGDYERAETMLLSTIERLIKLHGPEHKTVVDARGELADLYTWLGDYDSAERLVDQAIAGNRSLLGDDHEDTFDARIGKVNIWNYTFRYSDALVLARDIARQAEASLGPNHMVTLDAQTVLAQTLFFNDNPSEARPIYEAALASSMRLLGAEHPSTLALRHDVATLDAYEGKPRGALAELQAIRELSVEIYGPNHRETIVNDWHVADVLIQMDRIEEARDMLIDALARAEESLGSRNAETLALRFALAEVHVELAEDDTATKILQQLVSEPVEALRARDTVQSDARVLLAEVYSESDRVEEAIDLLLQARKAYAAAKDRRATWDNRAVNDLLWLYVMESEVPKAEALLNEMIASQEYSDEDITSASLSLAGALIDAEMYDAAEPFADRAVTWAQKQTDANQTTLQVISDVAATLNQLGRYEDAIVQYRSLLDKQTELLGADNTDTLATLSDMALLLDEDGQRDAAADALTQLLDGQGRVYGAESSQVALTLGRLAEILIAEGDVEKAVPNLERMRQIQVKLGYDQESLRMTDQLLGDAHRIAAQQPSLKSAEAKSRFAMAVASYESVTGGLLEEDDTIERLLVLHQLAWCYGKTGRPNECVTTYQRVVRGRSRLLGETHPYTLLSLGNLVYVLAENSHTSTLETLGDLEARILEAEENAEGTAAASYQLGEAYRMIGKYADATRWYEESAQIRTATLGEADAATLLSRHQIAYTHSLAGDYAMAAKVYSEVVPLREQTLGGSHDYTIQSLVNWGVVEAMLQNYDKATQLLDDGVQRLVAAKGRDYPGAINPRITLAAAYFLKEDYTRSVQMFRESLDVTYRTVKIRSPLVKREIAMLQTALSNSELHAKRFEDAFQHANEALETMKDIEADPLDFACAESVLGAVAIERDDFAKGETLLSQADAGLTKASDHPNARKRIRLQLETARRFIQLYTAQDDSEKLAEWEAKLARLRSDKERL